jgi:glycosyltransferase involved in cell wall biosynthesis
MSSTRACTVSVCVPAFAAERFVGETVRSVLAQTFGDFELLVADNRSLDNTVAAARTAAGGDPRVHVVVNDINLGLVGNWNAVVAAAQGRYVKVLCADDTLMPTCLERQVRALDCNPGAVMACSRRHIVDTEGRVLLADRGLQGLRAGYVEGPAAVRAMVRVATTPFGEPSTVLFRRDALTAAGPFSDRFASLSDCDLYARLLRLGGMAVVAETLATFRVHPCSLSDRSHHRQASDCRRLLRELAADPAFGISPSRLWQGLTRTELNALGRRAVYAWARLRDRRPPPRHGVADQRGGRNREPLLAATGNEQHTAFVTTDKCCQ